MVEGTLQYWMKLFALFTFNDMKTKMIKRGLEHKYCLVRFILRCTEDKIRQKENDVKKY